MDKDIQADVFFDDMCLRAHLSITGESNVQLMDGLNFSLCQVPIQCASSRSE